MVNKTLERVDISTGATLIWRLRRKDWTNVPVILKAAAWLYLERKEDWRLYLVTPLADSKGGAYATLVVFDAMMRESELESLQRRVSVVGTRDKYAQWILNLRPVGSETELGDLEVESNVAEDGIVASHIYLSV